MSEQSRATIASNDPRVQAALNEYFATVDRGESPDVGPFVAQFGDVADELRSLIEFDAQARRMAQGARPQAAAPQPPQAGVSTHSVVGKLEQTSSGKPKDAAAPAVGKPTTPKSPDDLPEVFGRYRVTKKLGAGAMGTVYLAEDSLLQRRVALKTPTFDDDQDGELLRRFHREARAVASLKHPNLCAVYDVGEIDGRHYISMEFVPGKKLTEFIKPDKPMTEKQAMAVVRKIALAMQEAHTHGVVHRDLKPDNIMVNEKGEPVVMDFGLVHKTDAKNSTKITQQGTLVGSPAYMSKEQVEGDPDKLTGATDQYSLGVILYQLLTSKLPFEGGIHAVLGAILTKEPPPPSQHRAGLNPHLEAVCLKMMSKSPEARYPSMKAAAAALAEVARGTSTGAGASSEGLVATILYTEPVPRPNMASQFDFVPVVESPAARRVRRSPSTAHPLRSVLYGSLTVGLALLLAVTIWFRNGDALVKVEVLNDEIEVFFQKDTVTVKDGQREVKAKPGEHTLHIKSGNLEFDTDKFTLKRGVNPVVIVELIDSVIVARLGKKELGRHTIEPAVKQRFPVTNRGNWRIENDELVVEGIPDETQRLVFGDPSWKDYDLKVETVIDRGDGPHESAPHGIEFLNTDEPDHEKHWTLDFGGWGRKNVDLRARIADENEWVPPSRRWMSDQLHGELGKWHSVEIRVRHDKVTVLIDGKTMTTSQHPGLTHGRIGVQATNRGSCRWRNFEVRSVDGTVLWTGLPELTAVLPAAPGIPADAVTFQKNRLKLFPVR